jgi:hypothetical protein
LRRDAERVGDDELLAVRANDERIRLQLLAVERESLECAARAATYSGCRLNGRA